MEIEIIKRIEKLESSFEQLTKRIDEDLVLTPDDIKSINKAKEDLALGRTRQL